MSCQHPPLALRPHVSTEVGGGCSEVRLASHRPRLWRGANDQLPSLHRSSFGSQAWHAERHVGYRRGAPWMPKRPLCGACPPAANPFGQPPSPEGKQLSHPVRLQRLTRGRGALHFVAVPAPCQREEEARGQMSWFCVGRNITRACQGNQVELPTTTTCGQGLKKTIGRPSAHWGASPARAQDARTAPQPTRTLGKPHGRT